VFPSKSRLKKWAQIYYYNIFSQIFKIIQFFSSRYTIEARKNVMKAASRNMAFWLELCDPVAPDLSRLHRLSSDLNDSIRAYVFIS
jgi:hypothetical protein